MPQPSFPAPCISSPTLVPNIAESSSPAASLALLERSERAESVTRRRGSEGLDRTDRGEDDRTETASSLWFSVILGTVWLSLVLLVPLVPVVPAWEGAGETDRGATG